MVKLPQLSAPAPRSLSADDLAQVARELASAIEGDVRFGPHDRMLYATDASLYQVEPLGVAIPASIEDAVRAVAFCARNSLPILPRGGGTSLAGQCTNRAVVVDFSPRCSAVLDVDAKARRCRVEPGITVDDLNDAIAPTGLFFAPDPATSRHANIGGCIGNNAAGARSIRYGRTSESIIGIDACLADGTRVRFDAGAAARDARVMEITRGVVDVVQRHERLIRERFPRTVRRNAGYGLDMILKQLEVSGGDLAGVNLAHLICGSEGTLAVTLGADLALHPRPAAKGLAVLGFDSLDGAIEVVPAILTTSPTAVELLDDTVVDLARANAEYRRYVDLMPSPTKGVLKAVLYVEYFGATGAEIEAAFAALRRAVPGVAMEAHTNAGAMLNAWKLRKAGEPLLHGIPGHRKPITFVEDNAIPVENLATFVKRLRDVVASHGTRAAFYAHASVGVLHVRPLLDIHDEGDRERMKAIAIAAADLSKELGGVMSGEHGDGRVRTPLLERFYGPELMGAFREVKQIFDPANLLNPGNIVDLTGDNPRPIDSMAQTLRVEPLPGRPTSVPQGLKTYFNYEDQHGFDGAVEMCNGAGVCRKKQGGTMCPSYMATLDERHSTRGRGNALRLAITGQLRDASSGAVGIWDDPGAIETLNLCLSCKACKTECPSNVDISRLKSEYTAQRFDSSGGPPLSVRIMGSIRLLNRLGSITPGLANAVNNWGPVRAIINAVLGMHPKRSLPRFDRALPSMWAESDVKGPSVALFGDCFTMFNEPGIGLAAKQVVEACGYRTLLADAGCCGRAMISLGDLGRAIDTVDVTLERLRPLIEDDSVVAILVAEPSCLSAIKDDWLQLNVRTPIELRRKLATKSMLPEEFIDKRWDKHPRRPKWRPAEGGRAILHGHCHQKALWGAETSANLLKRIFGDRVEVLDSGCCGMAGSFGYSIDRYDLSMKIGERVLFPAVRQAMNSPDGPCIAATGTSCRHQIHDGTGAKAMHPIEIAAAMIER
jgi:FAD/FMN-containing dehydrogenase/Fe-S oxidoreductase